MEMGRRGKDFVVGSCGKKKRDSTLALNNFNFCHKKYFIHKIETWS